MDSALEIGKTLFARNGDRIIVSSIAGSALTVMYHDRQYSRTIEDIGKTLFISNPIEQAAAEAYQGDDTFQAESEHLKQTQDQLETFDGFVLAIDIGPSGYVAGTKIGFDELTKDDLIHTPYFARMDINIDDHLDNTLEISYIGKKGVYHQDRLLISDWRSEIGQKYYMKNITAFTYNDFDYELQLRRALRIRNGSLTGYENEFARAAYIKAHMCQELHGDIQTDTITDPFLQDIIRQKHYQNKLTDIIESIQENQNAIITYDRDESIVVQGCAGSGKTMILLHRLSFMKYHNRNLDLSKIKILTPNSMFSLYINDLSTSLELESIDRLTVNEYYAELLARYYYIERNQLKNRCTPGDLLDYKAALLIQEKAAPGCPAIYSDALWEFIKERTTQALRDFFENNIKIGQLNALLKGKVSHTLDFTPDIRSIANLKRSLVQIKAAFTPYYKHLASFIESEKALRLAEQELLNMKSAMTNGDALIAKLKNEVATKETNLRLQYENQKNTLSSSLKQRQAALNKTVDGPRAKLLKHQIASLLNDLCECEFCLHVLKYERLKHVLEIDRKHLQEECTRLSYSDDDITLIENAFVHTNNFSVSILEKAVLDAVKREQGAALNFRNTIYIKLLVRFCLFGSLSNSEKLLCVDEGHDLNVNEYKLFSAVCGHGLRFNIYGDIHQLVTEDEGISDWTHLRDIFQFTQFSLNENYRNSSEIIEYCNETLDFDTTNLGISGDPVRTLGFDAFVAHLNDNIIGTRKFAIIVKKRTPALLKRLRDMLIGKLNVGLISPGEIAVLTPLEAKGLEFDTCYVLTKGMSRNEKYIAYTRALNELYIIQKI